MTWLVTGTVILWALIGPHVFYRWVSNRQLRLLNADIADNPVPVWQVIAMMVIAGPGTWLLVLLNYARGDEDGET
jgi:hypothetical protein